MILVLYSYIIIHNKVLFKVSLETACVNYLAISFLSGRAKYFGNVTFPEWEFFDHYIFINLFYKVGQ